MPFPECHVKKSYNTQPFEPGFFRCGLCLYNPAIYGDAMCTFVDWAASGKTELDGPRGPPSSRARSKAERLPVNVDVMVPSLRGDGRRGVERAPRCWGSGGFLQSREGSGFVWRCGPTRQCLKWGGGTSPWRFPWGAHRRPPASPRWAGQGHVMGHVWGQPGCDRSALWLGRGPRGTEQPTPGQPWGSAGKEERGHLWGRQRAEAAR